MTQEGLKPIRRLVTGNDERGKSKVVWDGPAPNAHPVATGPGRGHVDLWVWHESPAPLSGTSDDGNLPYDFPGPPRGGHLRVVQGGGRPANYDPNNDPHIVPPHAPTSITMSPGFHSISRSSSPSVRAPSMKMA